MAGTSQISGLSTGIDWRSTVDQLIEVERKRADIYTNKKTLYQKQLTAWQDVNTKLAALKSKAGALNTADAWNVFSSSLRSSSSTAAKDILGITTSSSANPGSYSIEVKALAQAEKVQSTSFSAYNTALGLSGELLVNGRAVSVLTTDTLQNVRDKINAANTGSTASKVTATILSVSSTDHRLILTSDNAGATGLSIKDASGGASNLLQGLGFTDNTTSIKNSIGIGGKSDSFSSSTTAVGTLLGLTSAQSGTVQINGANVAINLATMSLTDIKTAIDTAAPAGVTTTIVPTTSDGVTTYELQIAGTNSFTDDNNILETLGVLKGGYGSVAQVATGSAALTKTTGAGGGNIAAATVWGGINTGGDANNIVNGDTITFSGKRHDGTTYTGSYTITDKGVDTVQGLLTAIQTAYATGSSYTATAAIDANGKIQLTDDTTGDSQLSLTLTENNQGGGSLDFGTVATSTVGRLRQVIVGQDANIVVDGVNVFKDSNTVSDVIAGVTLDLRKAEAGTTVTTTISRDMSIIKGKLTDFVNSYNDMIEYINQQFTFDAKTKSGGVLFGDGTLSSIQGDLKGAIISQISGLAAGMDYLSLVGISGDSKGKLSIDDSKLSSLLASDFEGVKNVFIAAGSTTNSNVSFISYTKDSQGSSSTGYAINITQAATQGSTTGILGSVSGNGNLTLTQGGRTATVALTNGQSIDTVVSAINAELSQVYTEIWTASSGNTSGAVAITGSTTWGSIDGTTVNNGDTVTITGTRRGGAVVSGTYTISNKDTDTVQGLLTAVENLYGGDVTASLDGSGKVVVTDKTTGDSSLTVSITANNEGGGSNLNLGAMSVMTEGRYAMALNASNSGGFLKLNADDYGSSASFTVSNGALVGITDTTYTGFDVAGTINGVTGTGSGQVLTIDSSDDPAPSVQGLVIRYTGTGTGDMGTLKFTVGIAELLSRKVNNITDQFSGYLGFKKTSLESQINDMDNRIGQAEARLEAQKQRMIDQFVRMESAMSKMKNQSSWLSGQLAKL